MIGSLSRLTMMALMWSLCLPIAAEPSLPTDDHSGLVMAPGWTGVRDHCGACHSTRLVTQNRGTRETWRSLIRWMQRTQGLWTLDAATETAILDYLEEHYGPAPTGRRAPLDASLMPPGARP